MISRLEIEKERFGKQLKSWYDAYQRKLPWREQPSLYKTVLSEFMLQQTQVETVLPYFGRWLSVFPDFQVLADASEAQVIKYWEGLGYYARARNLHKLAKAIVAMQAIPSHADAWQELPGIGPYTSAAITSIAFGHPRAVVDGNVVRVLSRLQGDATLFKNNGAAVKHYTPLAQTLLNAGYPGDHNQAMMELGATVCLKSRPLCLMCPVRELCIAGSNGQAEQYPNIQRPKTQKVRIERAILRAEQGLLLHQIPSHAKRLANFWEVPSFETLGLPVQGTQILTKTRGISNERIQEVFYVVPLTAALERHLEGLQGVKWVQKDAAEHLTLSGPHKRWMQEVYAAGP